MIKEVAVLVVEDVVSPLRLTTCVASIGASRIRIANHENGREVDRSPLLQANYNGIIEKPYERHIQLLDFLVYLALWQGSLFHKLRPKFTRT